MAFCRNPAPTICNAEEFTSVRSNAPPVPPPRYNRDLPVFSKREEIITTIANNDITLIVGHTGSGKTTQIPQYLLDCDFTFGKQIVCTQPRQIAARSVSSRVNYEQNTFGHRGGRKNTLGGKIGYHVRLDCNCSPETRLVFMTEGVLLRIAMGHDAATQQSNLSKYSVIIIDEAHERTVNADILMGFLKTVIKQIRAARCIAANNAHNAPNAYNARNLNYSSKSSAQSLPRSLWNVNFKLVIMSATLDTERFLSYFECPSVVAIEGTLNPIEHYWLQEPTKDYIETSIEAVVSIYLNTRDGDILVFMPGKQEIYQVIRGIERKFRKLSIGAKLQTDPNMPELQIHPLYSQLDPMLQNKALSPTTNNPDLANDALNALNGVRGASKRLVRKCVVATNIAETSLTIDGIVYVVECGLSKQKSYDPVSGIETLSIQPISKASVKQRQGRCGRTGDRHGHCYHLYTRESYALTLPNETPAEMLRSSLESEVLAMLALDIVNPLEFDYVDAPSEMTLGRALTKLKHLECIDPKGAITHLGRQIALFPVSPQLARSILKARGDEFNCLHEMLSIASLLQFSDRLWKAPLSERSSGVDGKTQQTQSTSNAEIKKARRKFAHVRGDHLTLLNVLNTYLQIKHKNAESNGADWTELRQFCLEHYLDLKQMERVLEVRSQLEMCVMRVLDAQYGPPLVVKVNNHMNEAYYENIVKCLVAGHFLNVACRIDPGKYWIFNICEMDEKDSLIDFSADACAESASVFAPIRRKKKKKFGKKMSDKEKEEQKLEDSEPNWLIFDNVVNDSDSLKMRCVTRIEPQWLMQMAPHCYDLEKLKNDDSCVTKALRDAASLLEEA